MSTATPSSQGRKSKPHISLDDVLGHPVAVTGLETKSWAPNTAFYSPQSAMFIDLCVGLKFFFNFK